MNIFRGVLSFLLLFGMRSRVAAEYEPTSKDGDILSVAAEMVEKSSNDKLESVSDKLDDILAQYQDKMRIHYVLSTLKIMIQQELLWRSLPDLMIENIELVDVDETYIYVDILQKNAGASMDATFATTCYVDVDGDDGERIILMAKSLALATDEIYTAENITSIQDASFMPTPGEKTLNCYIDANDSIEEQHEDNNKYVFEFTIEE